MNRRALLAFVVVAVSLATAASRTIQTTPKTAASSSVVTIPFELVTAIDGKSAAELTLSKLNEMLERPASYKLTVKRSDQTLHVTLTPRKML